MVETTTPAAIKAAVTCPLCGRTRSQHVDPNICPGPVGGWAARYAEAGLDVPEFLNDTTPIPSETGRPFEHEHDEMGPHSSLADHNDGLAVATRLEQFRRAHEVVALPVEELEGFANDLIRQGEDRERARGRRYREPEVFSAADELAAVRYAREQGFITPLEAQKKVRKLLRLKGRRTLATRPARRRARA